MHTFSGKGLNHSGVKLYSVFRICELDIVCGAALDLIRFTARDRRGICIGGGEGGGQIYLVKDKKKKP